ncbi:MAG: methyltransferase, partial [Pseudomonadota bacterium]
MAKTRLMFVAAVLLLVAIPTTNADHHGHLQAILDARSDEAKARDPYRHPKDTLELFGIKKGMTVVDALPGAWYGDIIAPLIGPKG